MNLIIKATYFTYLLKDHERSWLNIVACKFIDKYKVGANNA